MMMDKSLLTTVGVVVCLAVTIYLFRELSKAKDDVEQLKNVSMHLMHATAPRPMPPPPPPTTQPPTQPQPQAEEKEGEEEEVEEIVREK